MDKINKYDNLLLFQNTKFKFKIQNSKFTIHMDVSFLYNLNE